MLGFSSSGAIGRARKRETYSGAVPPWLSASCVISPVSLGTEAADNRTTGWSQSFIVGVNFVNSTVGSIDHESIPFVGGCVVRMSVMSIVPVTDEYRDTATWPVKGVSEYQRRQCSQR
jgi:hypothetical protein